MGVPISVIIGACLIAAAILITNHWQIQYSSAVVARLNRWTGSVELCALDPNSVDKAATSLSGARMVCHPQ
jgi:hypothetical protein